MRKKSDIHRYTGDLTMKAIDYHRNGIGGNGFYVILFDEKGGDSPKTTHKMAVVFNERGSCAIFDTTMIHDGNIRFMENSWRGDVYEGQMREFIKEYQIQEYGHELSE